MAHVRHKRGQRTSAAAARNRHPDPVGVRNAGPTVRFARPPRGGPVESPHPADLGLRDNVTLQQVDAYSTPQALLPSLPPSVDTVLVVEDLPGGATR